MSPLAVATVSGGLDSVTLAHLLAGRFREEGLEPALDYLRARRPTARPNRAQVAAAVDAARAYHG